MVDDSDPKDVEDRPSATAAAAAYKSHEMSSEFPPAHRISFEDEDVDVPAPPQAPQHVEAKFETTPKQHQVKLGIDAPFQNAFFVSLGWSAGRALVRLIALLVLCALIGLLFWRMVDGL